VVYDVMTAREAARHGHSPYPAEPAVPESGRPQPGRPARGGEAGPGAESLTALPRRVQAPPATSLRAAQPELSVLRRVLRGLEAL
jgi:hypothetical protein